MRHGGPDRLQPREPHARRALGQNGDYVNSVANGNQSILEQSGYRVCDTTRAKRPNPPAAPTDLALRHGDLSGQIVARYHPDRPGSMDEAQTCVGDPNVEANWKYAGMFSGGKAVIGSQTPGTAVWVRVRTAGTGGAMSAWSDAAHLMVV